MISFQAAIKNYLDNGEADDYSRKNIISESSASNESSCTGICKQCNSILYSDGYYLKCPNCGEIIENHIPTSTDLVEYVSWCEKCGSLTEFYREKNRLKKVRCKEINNQYTIEYPEWLKKE
jgi:phage FluMu protein Com